MGIIISPKEVNSSPSVPQSIEQEYDEKTGTRWKKKMILKCPWDALYLSPVNYDSIKSTWNTLMAFPNTNLDGNLSPSKLAKARN